MANTASRLCSSARSDDIIVSEKTYNAIKDQFSTEPIAPVSIGARTQPVPAYKILAEKAGAAVSGERC